MTTQRLTTHRRGFSLLELFLTLSMAVVLMTLVNAAFRFYARDMDSSDLDMRQTMLAAAVLQMIEDDLRGTLHPEPMDTTALEELLSNTAAAASGLSAQTGQEDMTESDMEAAGMSDVTEDMTLEDDSLETTDVLQTPGLIGNQFQLQVDTSRLPRLEEYVVLLDADPSILTDPPSDLKTVTYYIQEAGSVGIDDPLDKAMGVTQSQTPGGLVRRELDRSATNYAVLEGNLSMLGQTGDVIATEVLGIEFSYWDGVIWDTQWNSDEMGELPLAIEIKLTMAGQATFENDEPEPRMFRHVVRLPMGKYIEEDEESIDTTGEEAT